MSKRRQNLPRPSAPKYAVVEQMILNDIHAGKYGPGDRIPSEIDLGRSTGFARMTVRRALERLVAQGILERRPGVGTFVTEVLDERRNVGLLIFHSSPVVGTALGWHMIEIMRAAAEAHDFGLRVTVLVEPAPPPQQLVSEMRTAGVAAVGLGGFLDSDREYVQALSELVPCVLFNKGLRGLGLPCAQPDLGEAARLVVGYFAERGRRRIGLLLPNIEHSMYTEFASAVAFEMHRRRLPVDKGLWFQGDDRTVHDDMVRWVDQMVTGKSRPDALLLFGETFVAQIQNALRERNEPLGRDLDVMYCSNAFDPEALDDDFPVLMWNLADANRAAAEMLLQVAERKEVQGSPVFMSTPQLVLPQRDRVQAPAANGKRPSQRADIPGEGPKVWEGGMGDGS